MKVATRYIVEPMRVEHISSVGAIERLSFPQPWPQNAYRREILDNKTATYIVARDLELQSWPYEASQDVAAPPRGNEGLLDRLSRLWRPASDSARSPELDSQLRSIIGYAGMWLMVDEGHITTIASHPEYRGHGVGELLLVSLIDRALALRARWMTLEVRASNTVAQNLYHKYTFKEMGVRKRYYSDNGEDALVMWTDALDSPTFREALDRNERRLSERMGAQIRWQDGIRELGGGDDPTA